MRDEGKKRQLGLDMLRILAMFMIVVWHALQHGGVLKAVPSDSTTSMVLWMVYGVCAVAVNAYVLISGYFLVTSKFKISKLIALALETLFYSVGVYFTLVLTGVIPYSPADLIKVFMPILMTQYWFITIYVIMYILSPILNIFIKAATRQQLFYTVVLFVSLFSVWPTSVRWLYTIVGGHDIVWFLTLYLAAAYIRLYVPIDGRVRMRVVRYGWTVMFFWAIIGILAYLADATNNEALAILREKMFEYNSLPVFLMSLALFMVAVNLDIKNRVVAWMTKTIAPLTLGVYLIHDNSFFRKSLWTMADLTKYSHTKRIMLAVAVASTIIFCASLAVSYLRAKIFASIASTIPSVVYEKLRDYDARYANVFSSDS